MVVVTRNNHNVICDTMEPDISLQSFKLFSSTGDLKAVYKFSDVIEILSDDTANFFGVKGKG